jgi:glutamyl-tRNA synthetase
MHVGTARQALFNYAFAKQHGGSVVLRMEDTDLERSKREYEDAIFEGLKWLGITPDESPEVGGSFGPYRQSERMPLYRRELETLLQKETIFYCSHAAASEEDHAVHWCDNKDKNLSSGILRFKTPRDREIIIDDVIRGEVKFNTEAVGDFSVARSLDSALYHFAVVVDDYLMQISHVIRAEDILPSTPKHILMQEALGIGRPVYAHVPLVLGTDRSKLSKRHGSTSLLEFKEKGYLPEALRNFLALLGWNPGTDKEIFSLDEFVKEFSLEKVQKFGAIFDFAKLDWMNGEYIRRKPPGEIIELVKPFLEKSGLLQITNYK